MKSVVLQSAPLMKSERSEHEIVVLEGLQLKKVSAANMELWSWKGSNLKK